ncbi:hypothetical protein PS918_02757 [Pseudomonas fluorescens]|uniref:Uncharacterized protein n=1 Tax=Pseudomonas fluorescens TaxID=294 RepID=A0A5E7SIN2_PSEFL|nr:hypothetical protein [Pseudomonas fluorescens]VVP85728.1 hypothetical protein PS918_02757 [Pseudomonas fluorescens]
MVRPHTLVEYRLKEFELEQTLRSLKKQQEDLDYKLDVEFYLKLEALTKDYGYTLSQVFDLLLARYEGGGSGSGGDADGLNARTNTGLLEMIQRLEASPPSVPSSKDMAHVSSIRGNSIAYEASSRLSDNIDHTLVASTEVEGHQNGNEEKLDD